MRLYAAADGTILVADTDLSRAERWYVHEDSGAPTNVDAHVYFHSTSGALHTGAFDGLTLNSFSVDFNFMACNPNPAEFSNSDFSAGDGTQLQLAPEPATLSMLGLGVCVVGCEKEKGRLNLARR